MAQPIIPHMRNSPYFAVIPLRLVYLIAKMRFRPQPSVKTNSESLFATFSRRIRIFWCFNFAQSEMQMTRDHRFPESRIRERAKLHRIVA